MTQALYCHGHGQITGVLGGPLNLEVARKFGPEVKIDQLVKEMIQNDKMKEPFAQFQSQVCA